MKSFTGEVLPSDGGAAWVIGDPFKLLPSAEQPNSQEPDRFRFASVSLMAINVAKGVSGTGTIKFSRPMLRQISDPRAEWNL